MSEPELLKIYQSLSTLQNRKLSVGEIELLQAILELLKKIV